MGTILGKLIYGIIIIGLGVFINVIISGSEGLDSEERRANYLLALVLLIIVASKYYRK